MKIKLAKVYFLNRKQVLMIFMRAFIFLCFFSVFGITPNNELSQHIKINIDDDKELTIDEVFKMINVQTDYSFIYHKNLFASTPKIKLKKGVIKVNELLERSIANKSVVFEFTSDNTIVITKKRETANLNRIAQDIKVSGIITDKAGQPLPGANILEKGTTNGAQSDFDGNFSLNVANRNATLVVSYLGFKTKEVSVGNQINFSISLDEDASALDEIVVVGYGTQRKSDLTGSVAVVSNKDFENQPISRVDQALQGRSPGVQVSQTSGEPGAGFKIRVRGTNSINGSNDPLYVVDGMVVGSISTINSSDIKSLEILKDASSTAIYGSRGANGVVLVTTKSGRDGKLKVNFDTYSGFQTIRKRLDIMNGADFAEAVNVANTGASYSDEEISVLRENGGTDWQDEVFRNAAIQNYQLSVTGGNAKTNYYVSGGYFNQEGILKDQDYKRYSLRSKLNTEFSKKMDFGLNLYLSREESDGVQANVNSAVTFDPTTPVYDADGNFNFSSLKSVATGATNPLMETKLNTREVYNNQVIVGSDLTYKLTDDIVFRTMGGLEYNNGITNRYTAIVLNQLGTAVVANRDKIRLQNTNMVTYDKEFEKQKLKVDLIHEQQYIKTTSTTAMGEGFPTDESSYKILDLADVQKVNNFSSDERLQSFVGRINYVLFDKYLFTGTVRADGSSKFRKDNRWGVFPSASLAWKLSEEDFLKDVEFISSMKLRGSYGQTGSQAIGALATRARAVIGPNNNYPFDGETSTVGIAPSDRIDNPDLTWEKTLQSNLGYDVAILNSKVTMSFDWYKKNTTDLLLGVTLPEFVGANKITRNIGEVENKGFDISIGARLVENDDFSLSSSFNFSKNSNKVLSLIDDTPISNLGESFLGSVLSANPTHIEVGQPLGTFRGFVYEGVYQTGEATIGGAKAGDPKYTDFNSDGVIASEDIQNIGNGSPDYTWGLNTDMTYKNISLNVLIQGSEGNDVYNFVRARQMGLGSTTFHAVHEDIKNSWTPNNPSNIPALDKTAGSHKILSSEFLEDGSYIRFKNVTLGYNFQENLLSKLGLDSMRLYLSVENLFTITDYSGYDPEVSTSGDSDIDLGIDWNAYPLARTVSIGLNVSF